MKCVLLPGIVLHPPVLVSLGIAVLSQRVALNEYTYMYMCLRVHMHVTIFVYACVLIAMQHIQM